jgi:hypothetical protein
MHAINVNTDQDENTNGLTQEVNTTAPTPTLSGNDYLDNTLQKEIALWFAKTKAPESKPPIN